MIPFWAFVAVTVPLVLTPGASTAVVLRNSIAGGTRAGVETAVGINAGSFCYGLLSALGVAVALQHWPGGWSLLRLAGVGYLAWLGVQSIRRAFTLCDGDMTLAAAGGRDPQRKPVPGPRARVSHGVSSGAEATLRNVREGFVTNALNPAIATFYLVLVPQFIPRGAPVFRSVLLLTAIHIVLAASWHVVWAAAGGTLARTLTGGKPRQALEICTGVALLALAAKIALA